jgi:nicotinate phosphoribosyltransferase
MRAGAPIDGFGIGTALDTSSDAPFLDAVYKLQEYAGSPRRKRSEGKATWPGCKQVFRNYDAEGSMAFDTVALDIEAQPGERLLNLVMLAGHRIAAEPLAEARRRTAAQVALLPDELRLLDPAPRAYRVDISSALRELTRALDAGKV